VAINGDGSVDVYFGPRPPAGKENDWVETRPAKGWSVMLRQRAEIVRWNL